MKTNRRDVAIVFFITWLLICSFALISFYTNIDLPSAVNPIAVFCGLFIIFLFLLAVFYAYIYNYYRTMFKNLKQLAAVSFIIFISIYASILGTAFHLYAIPVTLAALLIPIFFDSKLAFVTNIFCIAFVVTTVVAQSIFFSVPINVTILPMFIVPLICGTLLSFVVPRSYSRIYFIGTSIFINSLSVVVLLAFELFDVSSLNTFISGAAFLPIPLVGTTLLALFFQPVIELLFNVVSNFKLVELTNHNHPLLARLAKEAPGTFNHSLTVASLTETCAHAIGENVFMARACGYYHDIGKLKNPLYFKENQAREENLHDELTPEASTDIIRKHVSNAAPICKEYRIPSEIAEVAKEHHGTTSLAYFYYKAKELTDGRELNIKNYCYPGPTPSTKIAALVMICDTSEAAIRSMEKPSTQEVDKTVGSLIKQRLESGQFDNCPITMQDLAVIRQTIVNAICGLYHQRIKYPGQESQTDENRSK